MVSKIYNIKYFSFIFSYTYYVIIGIWFDIPEIKCFKLMEYLNISCNCPSVSSVLQLRKILNFVQNWYRLISGLITIWKM